MYLSLWWVFALIAEDMSSVTDVFSYSIIFSAIVIGICPEFKLVKVVDGSAQGVVGGCGR